MAPRFRSIEGSATFPIHIEDRHHLLQRDDYQRPPSARPLFAGAPVGEPVPTEVPSPLS